MTLTLRDVLRHDDLDLELVVGGEDVLETEVAGSAFLQFGEQPRSDHHHGLLLLTSGGPVGSDEAAEMRLIAAARRAGAAGIVRAVADAAQVPAAMREAAEEHGLALLTAGSSASLREIKDAINERVTRADLQLYQRLLTLQSSLIAAVSAPDPTGSLLRRLGAVVHSTVILYYPDGRVLSVTGDGPTEVIWRSIDKAQHSRQRFAVGQWHVVASLITGPDETCRWIVLAKRGAATADDIVSPLIATVEQLLDVIALSRRAAANEEALQRADVLARLISGNEHERFGWDYLRPFGFVPHGPCYVAAIGQPQWSEKRLDPELHGRQLRESTQITRALTANASAPNLVAATDGLIVLLVQASDTSIVEESVLVLESRGFSASAGVGRKVASLDQIVNSYRDARLALTRALTRPEGRSPVQRFEDFTIADIAISTGNEDQLRGRARDLLAVLEENSPILETLMVYLENSLSINDTANELHIHPNSVRYRIGRAEELIGSSLRDLSTIVDIYLAVQIAARMRASTTVGGKAVGTRSEHLRVEAQQRPARRSM
ncbi:helix-turn-helix domain-containing protein [Pseudonocardia dioxanivorans]|uniref:helix-turn-helix domain-containing protein n=1 Tax=Pseudonocardia dioxanivorans TaxID=240495 RepID=UPI00131A5D77|nr:helix-turn-helix domain-containing protein [Pseudonocardia dioxanivorans]